MATSSIVSNLADVITKMSATEEINDLTAEYNSLSNKESTLKKYPAGATDAPTTGTSGVVYSYKNSSTYGWQIAVYNGHLTTRAQLSGTWERWRAYDDSFLKGDTFTAGSSTFITIGTIGSAGNNLQFNIQLPKMVSSTVTGITFTALGFHAMGTNGRFENNINVLTNSAYSATASIGASKSYIYVTITKTSSYSATVLTPVTVMLTNCSFTFN